MMRSLILPLSVVLLFVGNACKRKPTASPEAPAPAEAPAISPAPATGTAGPAPAPVQPAPAGIAQAKPGASESNPLNAELTDAVARFRDKHKRLPASWQELLQAGFIKSLPQPPPGVRYAIDPISAMVVEIKAK